MTDFDYDLLVLGAGSGGVRAARTAAQLGAKVAIVEAHHLGGTCVNLGCVPKKLFVFSAQYCDALLNAPSFGWNFGEVKFDWPQLIANKNREIARLNQVYHKLLVDAGVCLLEGRAFITGPHDISIGDKHYSAGKILIAVGSRPRVPEFPGCEEVITSNEAFFLDRLPQKILIVGGGYIGTEFAGIFNGLGVETHLCHRGDLFLNGFDDDVRHFVADQMKRKGVHLHFNTDIDLIEKTPTGELKATTKNGRSFHTEKIMYAIGRRPQTDSLGLENTAVVLNEDGSIQVNDFFQTAEASIYALGDVVGRLALTPVALEEGSILAHNLFGKQKKTLDYRNIPTAVFCQPGIASVGLTEAQARKSGDAIDIYKTVFKPMQFSLSDSEEKTLMKLVVDRKSDKVVGCHMVGPGAAEIIQGLAVAITAGATKQDFDKTLAIHPTLAEEFVTLRKPVSNE